MDIRNYNAITRADGPVGLSPAYPYVVPPPPNGEAEMRRMWGMLRRRWRLMLAVFAAVMMVGALYVFLKKPVYESTAMVTIVTSQMGASGSGDLRVLTDLQGLTRSASVQSHIQLIARPDVLSTAAARMRPADMKKGFGSLIVQKWAVRAGLADKDSDVIAITASAYDPNVAADYANAVVNAYVERDQMYSRSATRQGREYVFLELNSVQKQLAVAQEDLAAYKRKVNIVNPESQVAAITDSMIAMQSELDRASVEYASRERELQSLHSQLIAQGNEVQETRTIQINPRYQNAVAALDALNARKATMGQDYAPNSKEMRKLNGEIGAAGRQLERVAQTMVASTVRSRNPVMGSYLSSLANTESARARVRALKSVLAAHQKHIQQLPAFESELSRLTTRVNLLQGIYQDLSQKYYILLVNENSTLPNARLASAAIPPPRPAAPNWPRSAVVFLMMGLLAAAGAARLAERLDLRVRDDSVPEMLLGEQPLAVIPHSDNAGAFIESFRTLRNVIVSRSPAGEPGVLVITSPGRDEGKRTVCVNLAIAMAWSGKKVLLVDADLRHPSLAATMNVPGDVGLTNLVCGLVAPEEAIQPTSVKNVYCMPAGPAPYYPSQFLNSHASLEALRKASNSFDMIIINGPPCVGMSDIQVVARAADAVAMVVMIDRTSREDLMESLQSLFRVNAPYAGYILNCVDDGKRVNDYRRIAEPEIDDSTHEKPALLQGSPEE
jgi:polysaccharide biosynthesis transport protein